MPRRIGLLLSFVVVAVFSLPFPQAFSVTRLLWSVIHSYGAGTSYYIANEGSDSNPGTFGSPWQTTAAIYSHGPYKAGDQILFKGGQTFTGFIYFDYTTSSATAKNPLIISSYGGSRATISTANGMGVFAYDIGNISISNLILSGSGTAADYSGVFVMNDQPGVTLPNVSVSGVDISGFSYSGMYVYSSSMTSFIDNVRILSSRLHGNGKQALFFWADAGDIKPITNVYVGGVEADTNGSLSSGITTGTAFGWGILLANVDGATVEYCDAHDNFSLATTVGGPYGIWTYQSNAIVFQFNESHHNTTTTLADGGGFDFDGGVSNSIAQYNYSHDNDGPAFIFVQYNGAAANQNNTVRYNVSQNDGKASPRSATSLATWSEDATQLLNNRAYNNTFYNGTTANSPSLALNLTGNGSTNTKLYNNIFISTAGKSIGTVDGTHPGLVMKANDYWIVGGGFNVSYGGTVYTSLASFRSGASQETGSGFNADPLVTSPAAGGTLWPALPQTLASYKLQAGSPVIDQGQNLPGLGISVGPRDFFGGAIPLGAGYDIGAHERQ